MLRVLGFLRFLIPIFVVLLLPIGVQAAGKFEVSAFIPYWNEASGTPDATTHITAFSTVMPFGYIVQNDGSLYDAMGIDGEPWTTLITAAHAHGVKVIPTIMWSNGAAIQTILSSSTTRIALETAIAALAKEQGFDGIGIDFENKEAQTKNYFSLFLKGLYSRMGNKWVYCSIEARTPLIDRYDGIPPANATEYANDFVQINKYCDRVQLMTYDQDTVDVKLNEAAIGPYMPISDPQWVTAVVKLAEKNISKNKLEIGIPTYGYEYAVTPLTSGYKYDLLWTFDPKYGIDLATRLGISAIRNAAGELSFTYHSSGTFSTTGDQADIMPSSSLSSPLISYASSTTPVEVIPPFNLVWWSDSVAIGQKVALAKSLGIRGVAIFEIDGSEDPNIWKVLP